MSSRVGFFGLAVALVGAGLFGAGCGGSSGVSCGTFEACGGDLTGTWIKVDDCGRLTDSSCANATFNVKNSGTESITIDSNGGFTVADGESEVVETVPSSCLGNQSCSSLASTNTTCTQNGNNCSCDTKNSAVSVSGTYTTSGSSVTVSSGGKTLTSDYCVKGDTLTLENQGAALWTVYKSATK